jgi:hypothetical protein
MEFSLRNRNLLIMTEVMYQKQNVCEDSVTDILNRERELMLLYKIGQVPIENFIIPKNAKVITINNPSNWPIYLVHCIRNEKEGFVSLFSIKQAWPEYITLPELAAKLSVGVEFTIHTEQIDGVTKCTIHLK